MNLGIKNGVLKGAKASSGGPQISHLHFADDYVLFGEATMKGDQVL